MNDLEADNATAKASFERQLRERDEVIEKMQRAHDQSLKTVQQQVKRLEADNAIAQHLLQMKDKAHTDT
jgi:hypothetical protein